MVPGGGCVFLFCAQAPTTAAPADGTPGGRHWWPGALPAGRPAATQLYDRLLRLDDTVDRAALWRAALPLRRGGTHGAAVVHHPVHWAAAPPADWALAAGASRGLYRALPTDGWTVVTEVRPWSDYARLWACDAARARRLYWPRLAGPTPLVRRCVRRVTPDQVPVLLVACWITEAPAVAAPDAHLRSFLRERAGDGVARVLRTTPDRHMFTWVLQHWDRGGRTWAAGPLRADRHTRAAGP